MNGGGGLLLICLELPMTFTSHLAWPSGNPVRKNRVVKIRPVLCQQGGSDDGTLIPSPAFINNLPREWCVVKGCLSGVKRDGGDLLLLGNIVLD